MKKIIIFEAAIDSLAVFARLISQGIKECGREVLLLAAEDMEAARKRVDEFAENGNTAALFFNHAGLNLLTEESDSIWNTYDVDCYDMIVDHPMYYHAALIFPVKKLTFLCVDRYHQKYIERFYSHRVKSYFFPLAGIQGEQQIPLEERTMDVLFTGAYLRDDNIEYHTQNLGEGMKQIWMECYQSLWQKPETTLEAAVEQCFRTRGVELLEEDIRDSVRLFQDIDGMVRSRARAEVVRTLADGDVKVHLYGEGWEYLECKQENLIIHDRVPFQETIPLIANAKIVLNVMPWFKAGAHDRIYSAMLNQSVCVTDSSEYLDETLKDGENVVFYSLKALEELPERIKRYLAEPELLEKIARNGYQYAKETQTFGRRAKELLDIMD